MLQERREEEGGKGDSDVLMTSSEELESSSSGFTGIHTSRPNASPSPPFIGHRVFASELDSGRAHQATTDRCTSNKVTLSPTPTTTTTTKPFSFQSPITPAITPVPSIGASSSPPPPHLVYYQPQVQQSSQRRPLSSSSFHCQAIHPLNSSSSVPLDPHSQSRNTAQSETSSSSSHRPRPLRLIPASYTSSSSSIRTPLTSTPLRSASARRLARSPYSSLPSSRTPNGLGKMASAVSIKQEPLSSTPTPRCPPHLSPPINMRPLQNHNVRSSSRPVAIKSDLVVPLPPISAEEPKTPTAASAPSQIASPSGSMSMSQRRGVRPTFPSSPRTAQTKAPSQSRGSYTGGGGETPQPRTARQSPYPPMSAPLQYPRGWHQHQSAPAAMVAAAPQTAVPSGASGSRAKNPYQANLDEIPKDFVLNQLIRLAPTYWFSPETADCNIIIPMKKYTKIDTYPPNKASSDPNSPRDGTTPTAANSAIPRGGVPVAAAAGRSSGYENRPNLGSSSTTEGHSARRGSLPDLYRYETCLCFPAHRDYLTPQSPLFHALLNSPAGKLQSPAPTRDVNGRLIWNSPIIRGAKVMPSKVGQPKALYLPLPDPDSFILMLHWLYWHDRDYINHCLSSGSVTWQGLVRNIEYLGLDNEIKKLTGDWWKRWVRPTSAGERSAALPGGGVGGGVGARMDEDGDGDEGRVETDSGHEADEEEDDADIEHRPEDGSTDIVSEQLKNL
nr:uncharacterized protein CI109_000474 [Kwoniella shandongensis]KAA5530904.1 hypothetical protein CI109_000474 [Kwoniella shandongensis]